MFAPRIECEKVNCKVKSYWLENIGGRWFVCVNQKHHGKPHVAKIPVDELAKKVREAAG